MISKLLHCKKYIQSDRENLQTRDRETMMQFKTPLKMSVHTDMVLDRMIDDNKNQHGMIWMDQIKFEWILSRFEK